MNLNERERRVSIREALEGGKGRKKCNYTIISKKKKKPKKYLQHFSSELMAILIFKEYQKC